MNQKNDKLPELVLSSAADPAQAQRVSRLARANKIRKIRAGVYTSNLESPLESIVQRNWRAITEHLNPGAVVGYRSAIRAGPEGGKLFLVHGKRAKRIPLPGLEIVVVPGAGPVTEGPAADAPYGALFVASEPRRFLENLSTGKGSAERTTGRIAVESDLERILTLRGERGLNALRDAAREVAPRLGLESEAKALDEIAGALLATHDAKVLHAKSALARAAGRPYDPDRIPLFDALFRALHGTLFEHVGDAAPRGRAMENFAFFEAYFSNFIEGTEFTVEEAEDIVFRGKIVEKRTEDSHDVRGTFQALISDPWRGQPPNTADEFLAWIKSVNALVMEARPDKRPGEWKAQPNQAGSILFVLPELVIGTLKEGFERIRALSDPLARALMTMFVIAEVHPFADGNGRTARIAMNAHLTQGSSSRIIIPTVYREDYVPPLKALSNQGDPAAYVAAMTRAQRWSASFTWDQPRPNVRKALETCNAFREDLRNYKLVFPERTVPT
jgi:hypothetical protein